MSATAVRLTALGRAIATGALVAACAGPVDPPPSPTPTPALTPVPGAVEPLPEVSFPPPEPSDIAAAIERLDLLQSYRFTMDATDVLASGLPPTHTEGTIVNRPERAMHVASVMGGAFETGMVVLGDRTWLSFAGSPWEEEPGGGLSGEALPVPVTSQLDLELLDVDDVRDVGVEMHGGVPTRHVRGTASTEGEAPDPLGLGGRFDGVVDAWIAIDGGHLVAARAVGTQTWYAWEETGPGEPDPSPVPFSIEVEIEGVDDPANVVEEPPVVEPTPEPSGDPAVLALIAGIDEAMAGLDAYQATTTSSAIGHDLVSTLTVDNDPGRAAQLAYPAGDGFPAETILAIDDRTWSRTGDGRWRRGEGDEGPTCGESGGILAQPEPCTYATMTALGAPYEAIANTFEVVDAEALLDGVPAVHLRSQAGMADDGFTLPGTHDLWIADDGGHLLAAVFTGLGLANDLRVTRIDDPAIRLEAPRP